MKRRKFIKSGALWVPTIFIPRLIRAQDSHANFLKMIAQKQKTTGGGGGSPTLVQSVFNTALGSSVSATLNGVANGNLIIVGSIAAVGTSYTPASANCSDTVAAYTLNKSLVNANDTIDIASGGMWSRVAAATQNLTITVTDTGAVGGTVGMNICIWEVSGLANKAFDAGSTGNTSSASPSTAVASSPNFNTVSAGIIVMIEGDFIATGTVTHTAGTNFSISQGGAAHNDNNTSSFGGMGEHFVTSASQTGMTAPATLGTAGGWATVSAAYK